MAGGDQLVHLPIEKGQQQGPDVRAIDIGVGHDHDLVVPPLAEIGLRPDAGPDGRDHTADLLIGQHLVFPALVGVDDLAP